MLWKWLFAPFLEKSEKQVKKGEKCLRIVCWPSLFCLPAFRVVWGYSDTFLRTVRFFSYSSKGRPESRTDSETFGGRQDWSFLRVIEIWAFQYPTYSSLEPPTSWKPGFSENPARRGRILSIFLGFGIFFLMCLFLLHFLCPFLSLWFYLLERKSFTLHISVWSNTCGNENLKAWIKFQCWRPPLWKVDSWPAGTMKLNGRETTDLMYVSACP